MTNSDSVSLVRAETTALRWRGLVEGLGLREMEGKVKEEGLGCE